MIRRKIAIAASLTAAVALGASLSPARAQAFDAAAIVAALQAAQKYITDHLSSVFNLQTLSLQQGLDNLQVSALRQIGVDQQIADANNDIASIRAQQGYQASAVKEAEVPSQTCGELAAAQTMMNSYGLSQVTNGFVAPSSANITAAQGSPATVGGAAAIRDQQIKYGTAKDANGTPAAARTGSLDDANINPDYLFRPDPDPSKKGALMVYDNGQTPAAVHDAFEVLTSNSIAPEGVRLPPRGNMTDAQYSAVLTQVNFLRSHYLMAQQVYHETGQLYLRFDANHPSYMESVQQNVYHYLDPAVISDTLTDNVAQSTKMLLLLERDRYELQYRAFDLQARTAMMEADILSLLTRREQRETTAAGAAGTAGRGGLQ